MLATDANGVGGPIWNFATPSLPLAMLAAAFAIAFEGAARGFAVALLGRRGTRRRG